MYSSLPPVSFSFSSILFLFAFAPTSFHFPLPSSFPVLSSSFAHFSLCFPLPLHSSLSSILMWSSSFPLFPFLPRLSIPPHFIPLFFPLHFSSFFSPQLISSLIFSSFSSPLCRSFFFPSFSLAHLTSLIGGADNLFIPSLTLTSTFPPPPLPHHHLTPSQNEICSPLT